MDELLKRRSIFRVLYISLFCKQSNFLTTFASLHKKGFVNVVSFTQNARLQRRQSLDIPEQLFNQNFAGTSSVFNTLIETRPGKAHRARDVSSVVAHPYLPILCQIEDADLFFVFTKTLAVIQSLSFPKSKRIRQFIFDPLTYKFLVIEGSMTAHVYKFTVDFENLELICSVENYKCTQAVFLKNSTSVLLITNNSEFVLLDLVWKKIKKLETCETSLFKTKMAYVPLLDLVLLINKPKGMAWLISGKDFQKKGTIPLSNEEISCFVVHKSLLIVGYASGSLKVVSLKKMSVIFEQTFEESDAKKIRVEEVAVCSEFVVVGLSNGTVSIVMKL